MWNELKRRMISPLYRYQYKTKKDCSFHKKSRISYADCVFEGHNAVGERTICNRSSLGYGSYIADDSIIYDVEIGKYCSIGSHVRIVNGRHPVHQVSTHPSFYARKNAVGLCYNEAEFEEIRYSNHEQCKLVSIGNDVWIGDYATILDGVHIADGTVIAAGAVVTEDTTAYSVVGGVPARVIKMRHSDKEIKFLLALRWWDKDEEWLRTYGGCFSDVRTLMTNVKG